MGFILGTLIMILGWIVDVLIILIIVRAVLTWIPEFNWRYPQITKPIERITEPVMKPFRKLIPPRSTGGIDLSPVLAIIALQILMRMIFSLFGTAVPNSEIGRLR